MKNTRQLGMIEHLKRILRPLGQARHRIISSDANHTILSIQRGIFGVMS